MSDEQTVTVSYDDLFSLVIMQTIEIEKLRAALKPFADKYAYIMPKHDLVDACRAAADALKETGDE